MRTSPRRAEPAALSTVQPQPSTRATMIRSLLPVFALLLAAPTAHAMRCGNRLVTDGAQDFQVRERCGEPFWADRYTSVEIIGRDGPVEHQREVQFDVWYYNFGPHQLMRQLVFRDGLLEREQTLGYGVDEIGEDCDPNRLLGGLSAGELVARCGEPASRRSRTDTGAAPCTRRRTLARPASRRLDLRLRRPPLRARGARRRRSCRRGRLAAALMRFATTAHASRSGP